MANSGRTIGAMLLLAVAQCSIAEGVGRDGVATMELRPTHIDADGNQRVFEKAFEPGTEGADNLSHARRSTVYLGGLELPKQASATGYHRTERLKFTSRASAFLYAYPTPQSKGAMTSRGDKGEGATRRDEYGVWIITCKHAVENDAFVGIRLNTTNGSSLTYVTTEGSWRRDDGADVAVLRFVGWRNAQIDLAMFEFGQAVEKERIMTNALFEGTPVALVGYPISMLKSRIRNYPVVQFGYIAQIQGYLANDRNHDVFLVGGAVFPGNSGGPVLIPGGTPTAVTRYFKRGLLVGMVCAQQPAPVGTQGGWRYDIRQSADLAQVVPMATIHRAIERSGVWEVQSN